MIALAFFSSCQKELQSPQSQTIHESVDSRHLTMSGFDPIDPCKETILVFIEDCLEGSPYEEVIPRALDLYNLNTVLTFETTEVRDSAHLTLDCEEGGVCGQAYAAFPVPNLPNEGPFRDKQTRFPSGGTIGSLIEFNINTTACPCDEEEITPCYYQFVVMHELGHVIGLYHNDKSTSTGGPIQIAGTPTGYDPGSIFNSASAYAEAGVGCNLPCNFSLNDLTAINSIYSPGAFFGGPKNPDWEICECPNNPNFESCDCPESDLFDICECTDRPDFEICDCPDNDGYEFCECVGKPKIRMVGFDGNTGGGSVNFVCASQASHSFSVEILNDEDGCVDSWSDGGSTNTSYNNCHSFDWTPNYHNGQMRCANITVRASNECGQTTANYTFCPNPNPC